jgi:uncharacterized MnhB-related membrane protein
MCRSYGQKGGLSRMWGQLTSTVLRGERERKLSDLPNILRGAVMKNRIKTCEYVIVVMVIAWAICYFITGQLLVAGILCLSMSVMAALLAYQRIQLNIIKKHQIKKWNIFYTIIVCMYIFVAIYSLIMAVNYIVPTIRLIIY